MRLVINDKPYVKRDLTEEEWEKLLAAFKDCRIRKSPSLAAVKQLKEGKNRIYKMWFMEKKFNWHSIWHSINAKLERLNLPYRLSAPFSGADVLHLYCLEVPQNNVEKPAS